MRTSESSNCDGERASERDGEGGLPRVRGTPGGASGGGGEGGGGGGGDGRRGGSRGWQLNNNSHLTNSVN